MKKIIVFLCVIWIGFIFYNSSQVGIESSNTTDSFISNVKSVMKGEEIDSISYGVDKDSVKLSLKSILQTLKDNTTDWKNKTRSDKIYYIFRM